MKEKTQIEKITNKDIIHISKKTNNSIKDIINILTETNKIEVL